MVLVYGFPAEYNTVAHKYQSAWPCFGPIPEDAFTYKDPWIQSEDSKTNWEELAAFNERFWILAESQSTENLKNINDEDDFTFTLHNRQK